MGGCLLETRASSRRETPMTLTLNLHPIVTILFEGRRYEVPLNQIVLDEGASEVEIRHALAQYLGVADSRLADYIVEQDDAGNLTVRPR
jgi:hypothetical protein